MRTPHCIRELFFVRKRNVFQRRGAEDAEDRGERFGKRRCSCLVIAANDGSVCGRSFRNKRACHGSVNGAARVLGVNRTECSTTSPGETISLGTVETTVAPRVSKTQGTRSRMTFKPRSRNEKTRRNANKLFSSSLVSADLCVLRCLRVESIPMRQKSEVRAPSHLLGIISR